MSSTRGGADAGVHFRTPDWAVDAVLPHLPTGGVVVDAGCGEGAILARVAQLTTGNLLVGVERDEARAVVARERLARICAPSRGDAWGRIVCADWLAWDGEHADLVVFNPPFGDAEEFLRRALALVARTRGTVAALLRANWHIPAARAGFVKEFPFDHAYLERRPPFAASVKCGGTLEPGKKKPTNRCDWRVVQALEAERPKQCPSCGGSVDVATNDSVDYAWFLFGPGRGGRFFRLDIPAVALPAAPASTQGNLFAAFGGEV